MLANAQSFQHDKEDAYAAYARYKVTFGALGLLGGVPVETTHASYAANVYTNAVPALQARYELAPNFTMRGTLSAAIARPGFEQITAANSLSPRTNTISQGNLGLRPTTAYSADWGLERVFDNGGLISISLFDKGLKDHIVQTTTRLSVGALPPTPIYNGFNAGIVSIKIVAIFLRPARPAADSSGSSTSRKCPVGSRASEPARTGPGSVHAATLAAGS